MQSTSSVFVEIVSFLRKGTPLEGAQFEVSYVDPAVHSGRWTVTTGADGKATISLPKPGAIRKTCSVSGKPLAGVQYQISCLNGSAIGTYTTDAQGIIYLDIDEPSVVVTELKTVDGYKLDNVPRTVQLVPGELTVVSYKNTPYPVLEIVELDSQSKQPLSKVKYKVFDGNMRELGTFATNGAGRIVLTGMDEGKYYFR